MNTVCLLRKDPLREHDMNRALQELMELPKDRAFRLKYEEVKSTRSLAQNAYLWGVCYATILEKGGETLAGWTSQDLHDYFLGEHFGWEMIEGFGRKRMRPLRRSSKLSVSEFMMFVDSIQRRAAELGIYIPNPDEGAL